MSQSAGSQSSDPWANEVFPPEMPQRRRRRRGSLPPPPPLPTELLERNRLLALVCQDDTEEAPAPEPAPPTKRRGRSLSTVELHVLRGEVVREVERQLERQHRAKSPDFLQRILEMELSGGGGDAAAAASPLASSCASAAAAPRPASPCMAHPGLPCRDPICALRDEPAHEGFRRLTRSRSLSIM